MADSREVDASRPRRASWDTIAQEYIEGWPKDPNNPEDDERIFPTYNQLAEKHGYKPQTVRLRASKERWSERKDAYGIQIARERQRKRTKRLSDQAVDFDEKTYKAANIGVGLIMTRLGEIAQEVGKRAEIRKRALERLERGRTYEKQDLYTAVNYREMESLASAAQRFQEMGMKALGTDVLRHEISGPDGGTLDVSATVRVTEEIVRDDPERVAAIVASMADAGLLDPQVVQQITGEIIVDAEEDTEQ